MKNKQGAPIPKGMNFTEISVKGLLRCFVDSNLPNAPLRYHISEVGAGLRSHAPHQHGGCEAVHVLEGELTLELGDTHQVLHAGEGAIFNPVQLHGLRNHSAQPVRYLVMLSA